MRGLIIRQPWIDLILSGKKTWEMRTKATNVRGVIALIRAKSGLIFGTARLVGSRAPLGQRDYMSHRDKHAIPDAMLEEVIENGWVHPWVLDQIRALSRPVPYMHPSGAVTFVNLDPSVVAAVKSGGPVANSSAATDYPASATSYSRPSEKIDVEPTATPPSTPEVRTDNNGPTFVFRPEEAQAFGRPLPDGRFLVLKDSTAMRSGSPNVKRDAYDRDRLVREGVLVPEGGNRYRFTRDHAFSSSSKAAGIIKDGNASGPSLWKHVGSGRSLKDCEALGSGVAQ
ncbi:DUF4357 domain-containing protein [Rhizobium leguminosarum]|uniref:DUF4357 domain-containing protein n=1 Tax=Rhizobium leguminosarum TaxID=384 RepID=UPI001441344A|nr:DUF4357 domain-containing protein [Rhizobium leguminosarum]NKK32370.1 DUF4357 domain-containing protein [Rhizobium leguminosarum bv. viciae]